MEDDEVDGIVDVSVVDYTDYQLQPSLDSDVEDEVERNEYEIDLVLADCHDDPRIQHNVYFDSDSESDGESGENGEKSRRYSPRCNGVLSLGQHFFNGLAFKESVLHYALKNKRNIRQQRYDKRKISFVCLGKGRNGISCRWRVLCSVRKGSGTWKIRIFEDEHMCEKTGECSLLKVSAIARLYVDKIRDAPEIWKPMEIEESIFDTWGISVTRNQTQSARIKAMKWLNAEYDDQFRRLRDYGSELLVSNPGSSVDVQCYKNRKGEDVFERFYVCFDVLRKSWKSCCRPLLGFDGTFLKGKVKGQLLVALGRDGDNRIYPVAWGVAGLENTENWSWFLKKIQADLELRDGAGYVFISDRQKGLIKAVKDELPGAEHRHCVRHIYNNLKSKFGKRDPMKRFIWDLAWSYNEAEYEERLEDVRKFDDEVYDWVMKSQPRSWCRAFYRLGSHCEDVENNSTESFNRTIVKAREKPFVEMLETIRTLAMTRIAKRSMLSSCHEQKLTPYASELLKEDEEIAKSCKVKPSTGGVYQVSISGCLHRVSLEKTTCTCRKWQIRGVPCEHAYGVILHRKLCVEKFVSGWFHTEIWKKTYHEGITPPRGARFWPCGNHSPIQYPTYTEKKSKKEPRKKGKNESPTKKKENGINRVMTCGVCGTRGHNSRFHKKDKKKDKVSKKKGKGAGKQRKGSEVDPQGSQPQTEGSQTQPKIRACGASGSRKKVKFNESQSSILTNHE